MLTPALSCLLRRGFEQLRGSDFTFGLCHADIALWNTLIGEDETVWLLDWGCAIASVVPHHEFNEIRRTAKPGAEQWQAFLDGYGISPEAYAAMQSDLRLLAALREIDTLRWAIDRRPNEIAALTVRARTAVANMDTE